MRRLQSFAFRLPISNLQIQVCQPVNSQPIRIEASQNKILADWID